MPSKCYIHIMSKALAYLGVALTYPVTITATGKVSTSSDLKAVREGLIQLIQTPVGTKFFLPEYGCRINELLFDPNDDTVRNLGTLFIQDAIEQWERRVEFKGADYTFSEDGFTVMITYLILASNEVDSFILPFYKELKY